MYKGHPVATKRALRAILKSPICAAWTRTCRTATGHGRTQNYDLAQRTLTNIPYDSWRELDPKDTLRFYRLWLYDFGELSSRPNKLIARGSDWRILEQIKRELKI